MASKLNYWLRRHPQHEYHQHHRSEIHLECQHLRCQLWRESLSRETQDEFVQQIVSRPCCSFLPKPRAIKRYVPVSNCLGIAADR